MNFSYQSNHRKLQTSGAMPLVEMVDMLLGTGNYEVKLFSPSGDKYEWIAGSQGMMQTSSNGNAPEHVIPDAIIGEMSVFALYSNQSLKNINIQAGGRYDYRKINTESEFGKPEVNRHFGNFSGSLGGTWQLSKSLLIRSNLATAYRIPNIAELTQDGLHGAWYEQGDPELKPQRSLEGDISIHYHGKKIMFDLAGYYNAINQYIYLSRTSDTTETGQLVYRYLQTDASIRGWETGITVMPAEWMNFRGSFAYTLARDKERKYLPFIPQDKIRLTATVRKSAIKLFRNNSFSMGIMYAFKQLHTGLFENNTGGYALFNAQVNTTVNLKSLPFMLMISAGNLFNNNYTDHLSTLKDLEYNNMGRSITFGIKFNLDYRLK